MGIASDCLKTIACLHMMRSVYSALLLTCKLHCAGTFNIHSIQGLPTPSFLKCRPQGCGNATRTLNLRGERTHNTHTHTHTYDDNDDDKGFRERVGREMLCASDRFRLGIVSQKRRELVVQEMAWQPEVQRNWLSKKRLGNQRCRIRVVQEKAWRPKGREGKGLRDLVSWV